MRYELGNETLLVGPRIISDVEVVDLNIIRAAIRNEQKIQITYVDGAGKSTERIVWPFALGYFDQVRVVAAWCESKNDFRHFRTDRIRTLVKIEERYPRRRVEMLKQWRIVQAVERHTSLP